MRRTQPFTKSQNFFNNLCPIATMHWLHGKQNKQLPYVQEFFVYFYIDNCKKLDFLEYSIKAKKQYGRRILETAGITNSRLTWKAGKRECLETWTFPRQIYSDFHTYNTIIGIHKEEKSKISSPPPWSKKTLTYISQKSFYALSFRLIPTLSLEYFFHPWSHMFSFKLKQATFLDWGFLAVVVD